MYCLSYVDLRSNPLGEGACETAIATILTNNPGVNLKYDRCGPRQIVITATRGGQVISPGEGEFEYANGDLICLQAQADPCFVFVGWSGSTTSTDNPMMYMMQGDQQIRANFLSLMDELHVDDNDPDDPSPGDPDVGNSRENGSKEFPFDSIQEAIDVAKSGATILVRPGTYRENLNLSGKQIHLLGIDSKNPHGGPCAIVEGRDSGPVVRVTSNGGTECSLSGFVLTRGRGQAVAAVYCSGASLMLDKCLIVGNRCSSIEGAILYFEDCQPVLTNCTIADNYAGQDGAGLVLEDSDIIMSNSILWGNNPVEISCRGESKPSIHYCNVRGWWPALWNLMSDPLFARPGCWVDPTNPTTVLEYTDLRATWKDGDYHLKSQGGRWDPGLGSWVNDDVTSCGIDTGDPTSLLGFEPMPNGGVINMGAYGGTNEASKSP
ncbi:MAG TPA: right-handed parallel beta-helix repeat-containing protein [Sedimentisphaerales bacterium]|nr:right-handed parallel beta-helix repeat-containing protein [Sedimentisphaerales bacterium]